MESLITVYLPVGVGTFHMETAADQFTRSVRLLKSIDGDEPNECAGQSLLGRT